MSEKVLVVGCGLRPVPGAVNLDRVALPGVDVVFDLDSLDAGPEWYATKEVIEAGSQPWLMGTARFLPIPSCHFDRIVAEDVLEHVADVVAVVQELGRVLRVGGTLFVRGPDADWVWHDVTHRRAFSERSFDGFCPDTYDGRMYGHYHGAVKFRMAKKEHVNHGWQYTLVKLEDNR